MLIKYVRGKDGKTHTIEFISIIDVSKNNGKREGTVFCCVDYTIKELSVYYRHERTWDDHMGNTPCGYYVIVPLPGRERKRVYIFS